MIITAMTLDRVSDSVVSSSTRSSGEADVARRHESAQTMAHSSSAGGVSIQLPLLYALARVGGAS
jgi:hypothetical protein